MAAASVEQTPQASMDLDEDLMEETSLFVAPAKPVAAAPAPAPAAAAAAPPHSLAPSANARIASILPPLDKEKEALLQKALGGLVADPTISAHSTQTTLAMMATGKTAAVVVAKADQAERAPPAAVAAVTPAENHTPAPPQQPAPASNTSEQVKKVTAFVGVAQPASIPKAPSTTPAPKALTPASASPATATSAAPLKERQPPAAPAVAKPKEIAASAATVAAASAAAVAKKEAAAAAQLPATAATKDSKKRKDEEKKVSKSPKQPRTTEKDEEKKEKKEKKKKHETNGGSDEQKKKKSTSVKKEKTDGGEEAEKKPKIKKRKGLKISDVLADEAEEDNDPIDDRGDGEIAEEDIDLDAVGEDIAPDSEEDVDQAANKYEDDGFVVGDNVLEREEGASDDDAALYRLEELEVPSKRKSKHEKRQEARREWSIKQTAAAEKHSKKSGGSGSAPVAISNVPSYRDGKPMARSDIITHIELLLRNMCSFYLYRLTDKNELPAVMQPCVGAAEFTRLTTVTNSLVCTNPDIPEASTLRYLIGPDPTPLPTDIEQISISGVTHLIFAELEAIGLVPEGLTAALNYPNATMKVEYDAAVRASAPPEQGVSTTITCGQVQYTQDLDLQATSLFENLSFFLFVLGGVEDIVIDYALKQHNAKISPLGFLQPAIIGDIAEINALVPTTLIKQAGKKLDELSKRIVNAHKAAVELLDDVRKQRKVMEDALKQQQPQEEQAAEVVVEATQE